MLRPKNLAAASFGTPRRWQLGWAGIRPPNTQSHSEKWVVSRDNGVQAQVGRVYRDSSASQAAAKSVVLRQQIRLFLEQLIDKMFIQ